jgi:hypothetical protein
MPAEIEANNTQTDANANAVQLTGSATLKGAIGANTDVDAYRLVLANAATLRLETFTSPKVSPVSTRATSFVLPSTMMVTCSRPEITR